MSTSLSPEILELKKAALCFLGMTGVMMGDIEKTDFEEIVDAVEAKHGANEEAAMAEAFLRAARKTGGTKALERDIRRRMRTQNIPLDTATSLAVGEINGFADYFSQELGRLSQELGRLNESTEATSARIEELLGPNTSEFPHPL